MKVLRGAIAITLAAGAAACTSPTSPVLPAGPSFDGGHTLGGGARGQGTGELGATVAGDSVGRGGGHTIGSGA
jgi:hypothetical protein